MLIERRKTINIISILVIVISIVALSIAFAILSSTIRINGEAAIASTNWDIHFSPNPTIEPAGNISINPIITASDINGHSVTPSATATAATGTSTDISYSVTFLSPGEQVQYEFYVINNGDYAGRISAVNKKNVLSCTSAIQAEADIVCNELTYTLTDANGNIITPGKTIPPKTSEKLILTLGYDMDRTMTSDMLPTSTVTVTSESLRVSIIYSQD